MIVQCVKGTELLPLGQGFRGCISVTVGAIAINHHSKGLC